MTPRDEAPVTLANCPPGLFETLEGHWGFKTEYALKNESDGRYYPEAYVVDSGEFFWGGAADHAERAKLLVRPLDTEAIRHRTAAAKARVEGLREAIERHLKWLNNLPIPTTGCTAQMIELRAALSASDGDAGK